MTDPVVLLLTGAEAEGSAIPSAVPVEDLAPETQGAAEGAPEQMEVAVEEATATAGGGAQRRASRTGSGSSRSLARDPGRGANPLGANVRNRDE